MLTWTGVSWIEWYRSLELTELFTYSMYDMASDTSRFFVQTMIREKSAKTIFDPRRLNSETSCEGQGTYRCQRHK